MAHIAVMTTTPTITATLPTATVHHSHADLFAVQIRNGSDAGAINLNGYSRSVAETIAADLRGVIDAAYWAGMHDAQIAGQ